MLHSLSKDHHRAVTSYLGQGPKDLVLVSVCGSRVRVHSHLLVLHSPLVASLLVEEGGEGHAISLPFPLHSLTGLANLLLGRNVYGEDLTDLVHCLGISWFPQQEKIENGVKKEATSGQSSDEEEKVKDRNGITKSSIPASGPEANTKMEERLDNCFEPADDDDEDFAGGNDNLSDFDPPSLEMEKEEKSVPKKRGRPRKKVVTTSESEQSDGKTYARSKKRKKIKGKRFTCDLCYLRFKGKAAKQRHMLNKHNIDVVCDECGESFSLWASYTKHQSQSHPSYVCNLCGIRKPTKSALDHHTEAEHSEGVSCHYCGNHYSTRLACKAHIERTHEISKQFLCTKCDYKTVSKGSLERHFNRVHTEKLNKPCVSCGEIFKDMKRHLQRTSCGQEGAERVKVPCPKCDKTFTERGRMLIHMKNIHDGIRDEVCDLCNYATYSKFNLRLHIAKVHLGTGLTKEQCPHCEKMVGNLKHHLSLYHAEQEEHLIE